MRILLALTYYRPHISGLTIYAERLARALAGRGHEVTVLTSQYEPNLPREERTSGVTIVRVPVAFRVSKGVVMPTYGLWATRLVRDHDVLNVHLPQFDSWGLALRARAFGRPCVITYHCDLELPSGALNRIAERVVAAANLVAVSAADRVVAYTRDYADHCALLRRFGRKVVVIPPPVTIAEPGAGDVAAFRGAHGLIGEDGSPHPVVGLAARFASEKGIETALEAAPILLTRFPDLRFLFAGPYKEVLGEQDYWKRLAPAIAALGDRWRFVGSLDPVEEMPAFFGALDCLLVTSVNSTESFGLVQVEAMLCGTPVVATDLPGVREPVRVTAMGEIVPPRDAPALADALARVLRGRAAYVRPRHEVARLFDFERTVDEYEALFADAVARTSKRGRVHRENVR
jgi:glycosyltransferase involved in cell wall biosynthesis